MLTTGSSSDSMQAALHSLDSQSPPFDEIVVVWNGTPRQPTETSTPVTHVEVADNSGVPGGRNMGVDAADTDVIVFIDDDATIQGTELAGRVRDAFASDPELGVIAFRVEDPETGLVLRRWTPRIGSDADTPGPVTRFPGGAAAIDRPLFMRLEGFEARFFYGHEETELSLRILDAGFGIEYRPDLVVLHPARAGGTPERTRLLGRNRVWLARLRLPWPVAIASIAIWLVAGPLRSGSLRSALAYLQGWVDGLIHRPGVRDPVSWRTIRDMTRIGQPPIV